MRCDVVLGHSQSCSEVISSLLLECLARHDELRAGFEAQCSSEHRVVGVPLHVSCRNAREQDASSTERLGHPCRCAADMT